MPSDFHPRYDASARTYEYRLGLSAEAGSPFQRRWCWDASALGVDPTLLDAAARLIPGERSFANFAKTGQPERGTRCHVVHSEWTSWEDLGRTFTITADRYLHHMVRYLVGTMVEVARGKRPLRDMEVLLRSEPSEGGPTTSPPAPPRGLFLTVVDYPPERLGDDADRDPSPSFAHSQAETRT